MTKKQLTSFRKLLEKERAALLNEVNNLTNDNLKRSPRDSTGESGYSDHLADLATDNFEREKNLRIASGEYDRIQAIDDALVRVDDKSFGTCESCKKAIPVERLKAVPYARHCIKCQEIEERGY